MSIDIDAPEFVNLQPWFFAALGVPIWKGRVFNQQLFLLFLADSHETFGRRLIYGVHLFNLMKHGSSLSRTILKTISENDLREDFFQGIWFSGLCPRDDVLIPGERHIWEHRLDAFGFFGDPFNYSTRAASCWCGGVNTSGLRPCSKFVTRWKGGFIRFIHAQRYTNNHTILR